MRMPVTVSLIRSRKVTISTEILSIEKRHDDCREGAIQHCDQRVFLT